MWPYSEKIGGKVDTIVFDRIYDYNNDTCNNISVRIMEVLRDSRLVDSELSQTDFYDDNYWYFKILWSPAFDGRLYQEELTDYEYAAWVMDHIFNLTYEMDFIAPFSANPSTLSVDLTNSRTLADRNTLYEMNVLSYINGIVEAYKNRTAD